jgi:toxin HigB-1
MESLALHSFMIKSFLHKGLDAFFHTGSRKGIQPIHAAKLRIQLAVLNQAKVLSDVDVPSWRLHALKADLNGFHAITVNANASFFVL